MKLKLFTSILMAIQLCIFAGCATVQTESPAGKSASDSQAASIREIGEFELVAYNAQGQELWRETAKNNLADGGEQMFLDVALRAGTAPTNYYIALYNDTIVDTDTLSTVTGEPSTNGYARSLVERSATGWPTLALDSGDYQATSSTETFTASGGSWGPVTYAALVTAASGTTGTLVSYAALSQSRTLASGESLQVTYRVKLQ